MVLVIILRHLHTCIAGGGKGGGFGVGHDLETLAHLQWGGGKGG